MAAWSIQSDEKIYTVSQLNGLVRSILEENFDTVWVEGEISNFTTPQSGHWYFSLKDEGAQVRCAMFRSHQRKLAFTPKNGASILLKARVGLYENKGDFQLIAEDMEDRGEGKLRRLFEILKKKLQTAGLFDPQHKKKLPLFPKTLGIITSPTGAAIHDILTVLNRRYPALSVIIYPVLVQGEQAASMIVEAIHTANRRNECDLLLLTRGGGSIEDLWPFNEESVAMALYESTLPTISGIGHEIDYTIADFVVDQRAPTPSAAAEMITPDKNELLLASTRHELQITRQIKQKLAIFIQQLTWTTKHLEQKHPKYQLMEKMQQLDHFNLALEHAQNRLIIQQRLFLEELAAKLHRFLPLAAIQNWQHQTKWLHQQLTHLIINKLRALEASLAKIAGLLDTLSPLATLKRGYAVVMHSTPRQLLHDASLVKPGDIVEILLEKGRLECAVNKTQSASDNNS